MKRSSVALIIAVVAAAAAGALDLSAASGRFGVAIINNTADTAPSPVVNTLGGSVAVSFADGFFLTVNPGLDIYWTTYEWDELTARAVPTESETGGGDNALVLGFIVDLPLTASFRFNERLGCAASLGPAFFLRASFANDDTAGYEDAMASNLAAIAGYFWRDGRWFYPSAALKFNVYLQQGFTFAMGARGFLPVFNAWTKDVEFWDHGTLIVTMEMLVSL